MRTTRKKHIGIIVAAFLIAGTLTAAAVALLWIYRWNNVAQETYVYIPRDADYPALLDSLGDNGTKLKHVRLFDRLARRSGLDKKVIPGRYKLSEGMSTHEIVNMFLSGAQTPMRLTINNIRTLDQLAGRLGTLMEADSAEFAALLLSDSAARRYGFTPRTFMAMFIPNTYEVWWTATPSELLGRMKREYETFWTPSRQALLERTGLDRVQAATLASIVAEETRMTDEMPVIAGVYINRLRRGIPLQADPTIKYALGDFGLRRILHRHLKVDSPYNTYRNRGLPPGPICMASIAAVDAVLNYQEHDFIYFCAKEDFSGYHNFAVTYAQHLRNARRWSEALNRRGIK